MGSTNGAGRALLDQRHVPALDVHGAGASAERRRRGRARSVPQGRRSTRPSWRRSGRWFASVPILARTWAATSSFDGSTKVPSSIAASSLRSSRWASFLLPRTVLCLVRRFPRRDRASGRTSTQSCSGSARECALTLIFALPKLARPGPACRPARRCSAAAWA